MKKLTVTLGAILMVFATGAFAGHGSKQHSYGMQQGGYEYGRVIDTRPIYREVEVSSPVQECYEVPVYHTERHHKSAGGMLAGGIIGGIIGHQIGGGSGKKFATAVGTLVGAQIGHDAVNGHRDHGSREVVGYRKHCETQYRVSYEQVIDGYDVTYKYRGKRYHVRMPYDPGERIKLRVEISPVF